jgi:gamma-glutamylcyclotransferase (GGCT)/AIG2-like uncharacterized protein YtfP
LIASAPAPDVRLFSYGTLMLGEVMELVGGRAFGRRAAVLSGFRRLGLREQVYPAIVPARGETLDGVLWEALDPPALARIDRFEGPLYERQQLLVEVANGEIRSAFVYVLRPEHADLLTDTTWDEATFRARHLADFLAACRAFAGELRD